MAGGGLTRRAALAAGGGFAGALALGGGIAGAADAAGIGPITPAEHKARLLKLHGLLARANAGPLIVEAGATLRYFTGVEWHLSERPTIGVLGAGERPILVTPAFEAPSVRESLRVDAEVLAWEEDQRATDVVAAALRRTKTTRPLALDPDLRFFVSDGLKRAFPGHGFVPGERFVRACRMFKSDHELALMQAANDITIKALAEVHGRVAAGMSHQDIATLMDQASLKGGAQAIEFSLVLLNEASAYPHGSKAPQAVHEGSTILMDCGCNLFGYQSDISRTWFFGEPSAEQRKVWNLVKKGQEAALAAARPGAPCGSIDDAVRALYEKEGWGPGYKLPGLPHRTGHGIGLEGHEGPYLVHGDATPLQPRMCFSDEPGLYAPGKFGVRLEDCWHMTEAGPKLFTPFARSPEDPI